MDKSMKKLKKDIIIPKGAIFEIAKQVETRRIGKPGGFIISEAMLTPYSRISVEIVIGDMTDKEKEEYFENYDQGKGNKDNG